MISRQRKQGLQALFIVMLCFLNGCYATHSPRSEEPESRAVITHYLKHCMATGQPCLSEVSFPFYVDGEALSAAQYAEEIPNDRDPSTPLPDFEIGYRLLPIEDIAVFWPEFWERFQNNPQFAEEASQLALVPIYARFENNKYEKGWLILRRVKNRWHVAGLIDG